MEPLTLPGTFDSLKPIRDYVTVAASAAGLGQKETYRLCLAVDEIATNIVTHGYNKVGIAGDILVQARVDEENLTITLEDTAAPFDPRGKGRPDQIDAPPEERPIGGLGVFLAMGGVDEFQYEYVHKQNRNIFVMRRPS